MDNAAAALADPGRDTPVARRGHELRSEEQITEAHEPAVAQLMLAVRQTLVQTLGPKGCYSKLAQLKLAQVAKPERRPGDLKKLSKRYAYQMSSRTRTGPDWEMLEDVAAVCREADRQGALAEFAALYRAATNQQAPLESRSASAHTPDQRLDMEQQLRALRQENHELVRQLQAVGGRANEALSGQVAAVQERATMAAENMDVKTRLLMANLKIDGLKKEITELTEVVATLRGQRESERWNVLESRQERRELNERTARIIAFVAGLGNDRDLRDTLAFLPPTGRLDVTLAEDAPPERQALAGYLWTLAGLTHMSVADLATKTDQPEDQIIAVLSAAVLPSYAQVLRMGELLGCDGDYLLPLYRAAETPAAGPAPAGPHQPAGLPWRSPARALDGAAHRPLPFRAPFADQPRPATRRSAPAWARENTRELGLINPPVPPPWASAGGPIAATPVPADDPWLDEAPPPRRRRSYAWQAEDNDYPAPAAAPTVPEPRLPIFEEVRASSTLSDPGAGTPPPWSPPPAFVADDGPPEQPPTAPRDGQRAWRSFFRRG